MARRFAGEVHAVADGLACSQTGPLLAHALSGYGTTLEVNWPGG